MSVNMNQFSQTQQVGQLALSVARNQSVFSVRIDPDSAETSIAPGTGVILSDGDYAGPPLVDVRAADSDAIFGVILYSTKTSEFAPKDSVEVAGSGSVVVMEASAAIVRGASVALVLATPGQVVTTSTETALGTALDNAAASGDLIRVLVA